MKANGMKQMAAILVLVLVASGAWAQTRTLPEEKKGAVIGGLIGASLGGPIGAVTGIIVGGGWIGKTVGTKRINGDLRHALAAERDEDTRKQRALQAEIAQLDHALNKAEVAPQAANNLELPIHFRTDSSEIESHYRVDLLDIAEALAKRPDARVDLSGFADRRGSTAYNQKLSEARVRQVKQFLLQHGVDEGQIDTRAFGESRPVAKVETPEGDFFDRRVVMRFEIRGRQAPIAAR